jgi:hypothetical protein
MLPLVKRSIELLPYKSATSLPAGATMVKKEQTPGAK